MNIYTTDNDLIYELKSFIETFHNLVNAKNFNELFTTLENLVFPLHSQPEQIGALFLELLERSGTNTLEESAKTTGIINPFLLKTYVNTFELTSITLPSSVTALAAHSFKRCPTLQQIDLSKTKISICGSHVIWGCPNLRDIILPQQVTTIEREFLEGPNDMQEIIIPDGCMIVKSRAFAEVNKIKNVYLPTSLQKFNSSCVVGHAFTPKKLEYHYSGPNEEIRQKVESDNNRRRLL